MQYSITEPARLYSILSNDPKPVFLLGAGASVTSGVPTAGEVVELAAKWAFAHEKGRTPEDPRLHRSDWFPWLQEKHWYSTQKSPAENYAEAIQHLLQPRQNRKQFFRRILDTEVPPSSGYEAMADMMARGIIDTVLTTNFDTILLDLCDSRRRPHHVEGIKTESDRAKFSTSPRYPQIVYLHGSVEHYTDKNITDEVQQLDEDLAKMLFPLLRDHPLVVVGYRGGEASVMKHLLIDNAERANLYRHGIYWCVLKRDWSQEESLAPLVQDLANTIGGNFQIVPIEGFDNLLDTELRSRLGETQARVRRDKSPSGEKSQPTYDMAPVSGAGLEDLEWPEVRSKITRYSKTLGISVPDTVDRDWLIDRLIEQNLAFEYSDGSVAPTRAGYLLFARSPQDRINPARVVFRVYGDQDWLKEIYGPDFEEIGEEERVFEGNLWNQLDATIEALSVFNKPFRLKGEVSENVHPYPPIALKEIIVNALAHRDYEVDEPTEIIVEPSRINVTNPGGLVEKVRRQMDEGESIQDHIEDRGGGVKGYRNPALADLFYGAGAMDKAGSGLADVYELVNENAGEVKFGPSKENDAFNVRVHSRPEAVDRKTGTASPLTVESTRYAANILEFTQLPERVWHVGTDARNSADVWKAADADWLPRFLVWNKRIFTFFDLENKVCRPLRENAGSGDVEALSLNSFINAPDEEDAEYRFRWLLKLYLKDHFEARGLYVDTDRNRAHFPRTKEGPRYVRYQARTRTATRTVVKPKTTSSGEVKYWEHQAFKYQIERFGDTWGLLLLPTYVFTFDGKAGYLSGERTNELSTRRASHDYNKAVYNHLIFWTWVLSGSEESSFQLEIGPGPHEEIGSGQDPRSEDTSEEPTEQSDSSPSGGEDPDEVISQSTHGWLDESALERASPEIRLRAGMPKAVTSHAEIGTESSSTETQKDMDELDSELTEIAEQKRQAAETD